MAARRPQPFGDNDNWGDILNTYLDVSLMPDGTLRDEAVTGIPAVARADTRIIDVRAYPSVLHAVDAADVVNGGGRSPAVVWLAGGTHQIDTTLVLPKQVTLQGDAARSTSIRAAVGFPTNTPLVQMGAETTQYEHNMWLRNLTVDCNHVAGSIGVVTHTANEPSGMAGVMVLNYRGRGFEASSGGGFTASHVVIDDCEFFGSNQASLDYSLAFLNVGNSAVVRRTTVSNAENHLTGDVAIYAEDAQVSLYDVHIEQHTYGARCVRGTGNKGVMTVIGMTGHHTVDALVHVTEADVPVVVVNAQTMGAADVVVRTTDGYSSVAAGRYTEALWSNTAVALPSETGVTPTPIRVIAKSDAIKDTDGVVVVDSTGTWRSVGLPAAATAGAGREYVVKNVGSPATQTTINAASGETIDGAASVVMTAQGASTRVISDGSAWWIV